MKATSPLCVAAASIALAANVEANGFSGDYREHNVTIALKLSMEADQNYQETQNGYKASQKIVTEKVSNRQILEALREEGVIDDIKGWKIKALTSGAGNVVGIFLTKKNEDPIDVSEFCDLKIHYVLEAYAERLKENNQGDDDYEKKFNILGTGSLDISIGDFRTDTCGIVKLAAKESYKEDGEDFVSMSVTKKASLENIVGEALEEDEPFGVIEGSMKAGEGRATDLEMDNGPR
ncbi:MAG: hypothetical protein ACO3JG_03665 [Luteolibacter sp.]